MRRVSRKIERAGVLVAEFGPALTMIVVAALVSFALVCWPRGLGAMTASPGPMGGAIAGVVGSLWAACLTVHLFVCTFLVPMFSTDADRSLYLSNPKLSGRARLGGACFAESVLVALLLAVIVGVVAGGGDAVAAHGLTDARSVRSSWIGVALLALTWQTTFAIGLAFALRRGRDVLSVIALGQAPIAVSARWLPWGFAAKGANLLPAGVAFARLVPDLGAPRSATADGLVLMSWLLAPWIVVGGRLLLLRRAAGSAPTNTAADRRPAI